MPSVDSMPVSRPRGLASALFAALLFVGAALAALAFPASAAGNLPLGSVPAQVPMDLVALPGKPAPDGYNPADPRFSTSQLCNDLGGDITAQGGGEICKGMDKSGTFCIVGSQDAFPCRGLYKHVINCNGGYNRPALNPFICGPKCEQNTQRARGEKCESVVPPRSVVSPAARSVQYIPADESNGSPGEIVIAQTDRQYTLALPENLQFEGRQINAMRLAQPNEIPEALPQNAPKSTVFAKISCPNCYPDSIPVVAEFQPTQSAIRPAVSTIVSLRDLEIMLTLAQQEVNVMVTLSESQYPTVIAVYRETTVTQTIFRQNEFPPITRNADDARDDFYAALKYDDVETARQLIVEGLNYFDRYDRGGSRQDETYLHEAAKMGTYGSREGSITGAPKIAALLISLGVYVNATDAVGDTPLHEAAQYNNAAVATLLLDNGANIDAQDDDQWTPLHWAASGDSVEAARLLIQRGADQSLENNNGLRPCRFVSTTEDLHTMGVLRRCTD